MLRKDSLASQPHRKLSRLKSKAKTKSLETIIVSRDHTERQTRLEHKKLAKNIERKGFVELPAFQVTKK